MLDTTIFERIRLKAEQINEIVRVFEEIFHQEDQLWIFGSRTNMEARGGDIDLYIETAETNAELVYNRKVKFIVALCKSLGDQKIDVVIRFINSNLQLPIYNEARNQGIRLK